MQTELQADCLAGVWAYHADRTKHILEQGDVEAAMNAASAVGDDRLQRQGRGTVVPTPSPTAVLHNGFVGSSAVSKAVT